MCAYFRAWVCVCVRVFFVCVFVYVCMNVYEYVYVCICEYMRVYVDVCAFFYIWVTKMTYVCVSPACARLRVCISRGYPETKNFRHLPAIFEELMLDLEVHSRL